MNKLFEFGKTYLVDQAGWHDAKEGQHNVIPESHIKYSLVGEGSMVEQVPMISSLLSDFDNCFVEVFRGSYGEFWNVYIQENQNQEFVNTLTKSSFDYLLWPSQNAEPPSLLLFDMDSTFIQIEVIDQLAYHHNVGEKVAEVTEKAMRGELDFSESLIERVSCLHGLSQTAIDEIRNNLPLSEGIEVLVEKAKNNGSKVSIVSGGFTPFVETLKKSMGLYAVKANHLEIKDGALTGRVEGKIVDAKAKKDYLLELTSNLGLTINQTMAIGDGANDLQMMDTAGFNLAYRAKPAVQSAANGRFNHCNFEVLADIFCWG